MVRRERPTPPVEPAGEVPSQAAKVRKPRRWHERTSVTLTVAAGLLVVALGFVHIVTGIDAESHYELPFAIVFKKSFGYRETLVNVQAIRALPYPAARLKYPLGCEVLQRYGYLPSGHTFEARMAVGRLEDLRRWQAEFARRLARAERPWEQRLQTGSVEGPVDPQGAQADNLQGIAYAQQGDYQAALAAFGRAIRKAPTRSEAFYNRTLVYIAIGNLGQGADDLGLVVAIRPDFVEGHIERARLFLAISCYKEAMAACNLAIEHDPDCPEAYLIRALACYVQGQYDDAWQDIRQLERLGTPAPVDFITALNRASGRNSGT